MKLWQKNQTQTEKTVENFTVGQDRELDLFLAPFDVLGSLAHIQMLAKIGLLTENEYAELRTGLHEIYTEIAEGGFEIAEGIEDVHSQVEFLLSQRLGEIGKKIHSGRSRNDQVLLDLKLFMRHETQKISLQIRQLFDLLLDLSHRNKNFLLAGYTHTQIAMPSSFGLWFGAFAESLADDMLLLQTAYKIINQNPLGSAAGYGSSFPLDRSLTTELLGFEKMNYNVVYAQMSRGKTEKILSTAMASVGATLNKLATDICFFMCQNMAFVGFPPQFTTGSSIMPHKKNPDIFELVRAKTNRLQAVPNEISLLLTNQISGYHRDLQLVKEIMIPAILDLQNCLQILLHTLPHIEVKTNILADPLYDYLFSVEVVNQEVMQGKSFREAYRSVGESIENGTYKPQKSVNHTHEGSIGNLCNDQIRHYMDTVQNGFGFEKAEKMYELLNAV